MGDSLAICAFLLFIVGYGIGFILEAGRDADRRMNADIAYAQDRCWRCNRRLWIEDGFIKGEPMFDEFGLPYYEIYCHDCGEIVRFQEAVKSA